MSENDGRQAASHVCNLRRQSKGTRGGKRLARPLAHRPATCTHIAVYMVDAFGTGQLGSGSMLVDAVQPQIMEAIVIHVPGKTHAAAYRMHAKEA